MQHRRAQRFRNCFLHVLILAVRFFDHCFPKRTIRIRTSDPEWMQLSLKVLIDDRDRAYHNKNWQKFHRLRTKVISRIVELKNAFVSKVKCSKNSKKLWQSLRSNLLAGM